MKLALGTLITDDGEVHIGNSITDQDMIPDRDLMKLATREVSSQYVGQVAEFTHGFAVLFDLSTDEVKPISLYDMRDGKTYKLVREE